VSKNKAKPFLKYKHGRTTADLGRLVAEDDAELALYYTGRDLYVDRALSYDDPASFFVGPKGSGKSAILQMVRLERGYDRIINISPRQLALSAFSGMSVNSPLLTNANKHHWLYKALWEYIIITEIGGKQFIDESYLFRLIGSIFGSDTEKKIRRLLTMHFDENGKPETMSVKILKIVKEMEISGGLDIDGIKLDGKATVDFSKLPKRGEFEVLGLVHNISSKLATAISGSYHIVIDDLDIDWHNEPIQNEIVSAMFGALRTICRPPNLKCAVAIQERIFRELNIEHKDKFREMLCSIDWSKDVVQGMVDKRIKYFIDIPQSQIWNGLFPNGAYDFIWSHTTGTPREVIRLTSLCLEKAKKNGHASVQQDDVEHAYRDFSRDRLEDIAAELNYLYPDCIQLLYCFNGYHKEFSVAKVREAVASCILKCMETKNARYGWIKGYEANYIDIARVLLENNILLFKKSRTDSPRLYNATEHDISNDGVYVAFHPMYYGALGLIGQE
jgi:hypothetical protein